MSGNSSAVDQRSFQWPLAPALAKLEIDSDRAQRVLAQAKRHAAASRRATAEQQRYASDAEASTARMVVRRLDPRSHSLALAGLVLLRQRIDIRSEQQRELDGQARRAADRCAALQRRLEIMQGLLRRAERQHARAALQRQCREADLAWLASREARAAEEPAEWSGS